MKIIEITFDKHYRITDVSDSDLIIEQENVLEIKPIFPETVQGNEVRVYLAAQNGGGGFFIMDDVTFIVPSEYMREGDLKVGFEIEDGGKNIRFEPFKVSIRNFVRIGEAAGKFDYTVTVSVDSVETLDFNEPPTVENVGTGKDVKLKFGIPKGNLADEALALKEQMDGLISGAEGYAAAASGFAEDAEEQAGFAETAKDNAVAALSGLQTQVDNMADGSPKGVYSTLTDLETARPAGDTGIYIVSASGHWYYWNGDNWADGGVYQATLLEDGSIMPSMAAFFTTGKNLFNKYTVTVGKYVYWVDGTLVNSANYVASDYIAVMPETKYAKNYSNHIAYYDVDKLFLSGVQFSGTTIETPADCRYIRISVAVGSAFEQVELGETTTSYESFHFKIKEDLPTAPIKLIPAGRVGTAEIADAAVTSEKIANEAVTSEKLSAGAVDEGKISDKAVGFDKLGFTVGGLNLFNAATAIEGYYVSNITGGIWSNATYWASDYIEVEPETEYTENYSYYMAFYDDTKTFISGLGMTAKPHLTPRTFTTPAGCKFMRVSIYQSFLNLFQVEKGYFVSHFEKYRGYIDNSALPGETANTLLLNVAPTIPAVVGKTVNVYFDNIMCADNIDNYQLDVTCAKGKHRREKWEYTPGSGDVGAVNFEIAVYKKFGLVGKVKRSLKTVAANSGAGQTLKVNIIGDSTTANGVMVGELYNLFNSDDMSVTFIGTQGDNPKKHEGHSGKNAEWIQTNGSSPFVFSGSFDYAEYLNANSLDAPDVVILNLGINDMFTYIADNDVNAAVKTFIGRYDAMMENIKLANADMKFGVCVTIPSGNQDAFGSSYDCGQTSWRYKRNNRILGNALINYYKGKEDDNIYLVPINVNLDTVNNMAMGAAAAINSRNPATIQRQINGVHPGNYGYYQIADMMFCWLKSIA